MISNGLLSWQQANGFRQENNSVYGVYNGIGFAVSGEDGGKLFTFMLSGPDAAFDGIEDRLMAERSRLNEVQVGDVENYLALFFEENRGEMPAQLMTDLLDFVQANARICGFTVPRVCVKCGAPANKRSFYNNMVQPMCASCREAEKANARPAPRPTPAPAPSPTPRADSLMNSQSRYNPDEDDTYDQYAHTASFGAQQQVPFIPEEPRKKAAVPPSFAPVDTSDMGDTGKGILGAALGAIAGLVPFYLSVLLKLELTFLCAAAGIGAVLGYVAFGGLKKKNSAFTAILIFAEVFSVLAFVAIHVVTGMGGGLTFGEALGSSVFSKTTDYVSFIIAILSPFLGAAITLDPLSKYIGTSYFAK